MPEEQRKKVLSYLQALYSSLKEIIEECRSAIKTNDEDFDHITSCLSKFKQDSSLMLTNLSAKTFGEQLKLEDCVFEWARQFKQDQEVFQLLQTNMQLLTDWKEEMKVYISKSPLIKNNNL